MGLFCGCWMAVAFTIGVTAGIGGLCLFLDKRFGLFSQLFRKVNEQSERNGGELVAQVLKAHGVNHVFTLCGGHISPIIVALEKLGVRIVDTRHEATAVFAADAVARMSGTVGVAIVTAGPGLTNTITAVKNAQMAESPVVIIGGAAATILKGRGALQDIDQMVLFEPLCKFCATVKTIREIVPTMRKALCQAQSGTPGPVFLEFPIDTLFSYATVVSELGIKPGGKSLSQKMMYKYLKNYADNIFDNAWNNVDYSPLRVVIPQPTYTQVEECFKMIQESKRPVLILGSQVTLPPVPVNVLRKSLERMGIPCSLGGMSRGLLGRNSPIQVKQKRREALKEADLVILAGSCCDFRLSYGRVLSKSSKIIAANRNRNQLLKNSDLFWKPNIAIEADAATLIVQVTKKLDEVGYACATQWVQTLRTREIEKEELNKQMSEEKTEKHLNPLKVLSELEQVLNDNSILVVDGGDFAASAAYTLQPRGPLQWLDPGAFGTLGVGGGFALGAKLCRPQSDVWIIYGDGSCGYSIIEYDTFDRHQTPVISLVGNDAMWMQIARDQTPRFKSSIGCTLKHSNYEKVAEAFNGKGFILRREDEDKIPDVLLEAMRINREESRSIIINALIGSTKFREGSIAV